MITSRWTSAAVLLSPLFFACGGEKREDPLLGTLVITLHDLPAEVPAGIHVTGPEGFTEVVDASEVMEGLTAGRYHVQATPLADPARRFAPSSEAQQVEVEEGETAHLEIAYIATERTLFELQASDLVAPIAGVSELVVEVTRSDGYAGPIELRVQELPQGFAASDAVVAEGDSTGRIPLSADGSAGALTPFDVSIVGEALGLQRDVVLQLTPALIVVEAEDGALGSLRNLVEVAAQLEGSEVPTISFDGQIFGDPPALAMTAPLVLESDVVLQGIPGDDAPRLVLDGGDATRLLSIEAGATIEIRDLGFQRGLAESESGGAIANHGSLRLARVQVLESEAQASGGCIHNTGDLEMEDSLVAGCVANAFGGGIYASGGSVRTTLLRTRVEDNGSGVAGGGVYQEGGQLELTESVIAHNEGGSVGGGLYGEGDSTIVSSTFEGNHAIQYGGGIYSEGELVMEASTVHGNLAQGGAGLTVEGAATLLNSTITGNEGSNGPGAIWAREDIADIENAVVAISFTTIADNPSAVGAGIWVEHEVSLHLDSSIVWSHSSGDDIPDIHFDFLGGLVSRGFNMVGETNLEAPAFHSTDQLGVDPSLVPLSDNGGPTQTMGLDATSPALDAIPPEDCLDANENPILTDQRGFPRPVGDGCDIGAFEAD